ncbi:hypothetical protein [Kocuria flava]|nr:hypothetical protein [Kocuria flava]
MVMWITGAAALVVAVGWLTVQAARRWLSARRRRWVCQGLDALHVDLESSYGTICSHAAVHPGQGAPAREELTWALDQVERVVRRHREQEGGSDRAPFVPRAHLVAVLALGATGFALLVASAL